MAQANRFESVVLFALDQFCLLGYPLPLSHGMQRSVQLVLQIVEFRHENQALAKKSSLLRTQRGEECLLNDRSQGTVAKWYSALIACEGSSVWWLPCFD